MELYGRDGMIHERSALVKRRRSPWRPFLMLLMYRVILIDIELDSFYLAVFVLDCCYWNQTIYSNN